MKIALISANLGDFDKPVIHESQSVEATSYYFTDYNFPPRKGAMTSRLQARIPKMFGWQMAPDYDVYIWVDSSCRLSSPDSVEWFIEQLGNADMALFRHPHRKNIFEEADYLKHRLSIKCPYITPRYKDELIDELLEEVVKETYLPKDLFATTAFIYRNNPTVHNVMRDWWYYTSRYHCIDQLGLPPVIANSDIKVNIIEENYLKVPYLEYVRNK